MADITLNCRDERPQWNVVSLLLSIRYLTKTKRFTVIDFCTSHAVWHSALSECKKRRWHLPTKAKLVSDENLLQASDDLTQFWQFFASIANFKRDWYDSKRKQDSFYKTLVSITQRVPVLGKNTTAFVKPGAVKKFFVDTHARISLDLMPNTLLYRVAGKLCLGRFFRASEILWGMQAVERIFKTIQLR